MVDVPHLKPVPDPQPEQVETGEGEAPEPQRADLADAIVFVARWHGLGPDRADVIHSLPETATGPSLDYLDDMASRAGLSVHFAREAPHRISPVTPPVILLSPAGAATVLTRIDRTSGKAELVDPLAPADAPEVAPLAELRGRFLPFVVYAVPAAGGSHHAAGTGGHWFWSAVRRFWPNYVQVIAAALLINLLGLAAPLFIMNVYDRVIPNLAIPTLWALTAGVVLAVVFDVILKLLRARIVDDTGRRVDMAVAGRLFDHVLGLKLSGRPASGGAFASRIRDFDAVRDVLTSSSVVAITDLAFIGIFLWVMWLIVGPLMLVPAIAVPIVLVLTLLIQMPLAAALRRAQADSAMRQGILVETLSGIETLKAAGAEGWMRRLWDHAVAASSRANAAARFWSTAAVTIVASAGQTVSVVIVVWGVFLVISGDITVGALIAANILSGRVLAPLSNVAQTLSRLAQARGALTALGGIMAQPVETGAAGGSGQAVKGGIGLDGVRFVYPDAAGPALDGVSFKVAPGERVGIIGRVGSGKSTLGRLVSGLYAADEGTVLVDGLDIRQIGVARLRTGIGYCPQEPDLFSGTLRSNIVMGRPFADAAALQRAVELSGVAAFADDHPQGLDMPVAEGGRSLSGGQRQAVALARVMIRDPKVLYLDEPSAALDVRSEARLMRSLRAIAETGVTLFLATHRDRLLDLVDRIIVFEKGRLVLDGPKADVIATLRQRAREGSDASD